MQATTILSPAPHGIWQPPALEEMRQALPGFEFTGVLGRGGMGAVYQAVEVSLGRVVAIKVLPADLMEQAEACFTERFEQEARTMARLNHPGIVRVFDSGRTGGGLLYFVMEYVDGTDLARLLREGGKLTPEKALDLAGQLCEALSYAHREGVVHRDIKPANILLSRDGQAKIADFGLAKHQDVALMELTKTNVTVGTPDYLAPEAWTPGTPLDGRADLYAAGVVLYQMLTGEVPRGLWKAASERAGTDARFDAIVDKAMQPDRDLRYATAADILTDLEAVRSGPAPPPAAIPPTRRKARKRAAVAGIFAAGLTGAIFLWPAREKPARTSSTRVTNIKDDGEGSLRQAFLNADLNPGPDAITFAPELAGRTIRVGRGILGVDYERGGQITIDASALQGGLTLRGPRIVWAGPTVDLRIRGVRFEFEPRPDSERDSMGNQGRLTLVDCTLTSAAPDRNAGCAISNLGTMELIRCTLTGNSIADRGGIIGNMGTLSMTDCFIADNAAGDYGGAISQMWGHATLTRCTFYRNAAGTRGGAIAIEDGTVTAVQCTFAGNQSHGTVSALHGGGGCWISDTGQLILDKCIVADNNAATGRGPDIWNRGGRVEAVRSFLGRDQDAKLQPGNSGNLTGTAEVPLDPELSPPGNYGGPVQTMPPLPGSPAVGMGAGGTGG